MTDWRFGGMRVSNTSITGSRKATRPLSRALRLTCITGIALSTYVGCARDTPPRPGDLRGTVLPEPIPRPGVTLTTTGGVPFDFRAETRGTLTLLFFGYTHCPDICPVHMANIAAVLGKLPPQLANRVTVIMVTVDPERDTPERLRAWLDGFDRSFIGLTGTTDDINAAQRSLHLPSAVRQGEGPDYLMGHAAYVIAFTPDDSARVLYPSGTRQADWAHDLPILLETRWGTELPD